MTLEGSSSEAFFPRAGVRSLVKKNMLLTFVSITLSQPFSEKFSYGSPHAAPALFTKISRLSS